MLKDLESQIWDVAHQAEDVINTFINNMANNNRRNGLGKLGPTQLQASYNASDRGKGYRKYQCGDHKRSYLETYQPHDGQMASSVSSYLNQEPKKFLNVSLLSYEDLPPHLKLSFLYFRVFPEDFEILASQLIRLWIVEGFVEQGKNRTMEDIAEDYLEELINNSLIVVVKMSSYGSIKSCCIHDLLRDLSITKGVQENFFTIHSEKHKSTSSTSATVIVTLPSCADFPFIASPPRIFVLPHVIHHEFTLSYVSVVGMS
ncbi:hypothetical protein LguiA_018461 [Lonicera macranthoides]